ncbi:MAG: hypothetical protein M1823_004408 [Watsoniomyces obsoletus]|nr:MAG: hypothetical protein M1823_004408 [Watsoniomyces obsoletus]
MTELSFAKQFLTTLSSQPVKVPIDHVEDPRKFPARPAYILPKMPHKMNKRQKHALAPGQESSVTVSFKSIRDASFQMTLSQQPLSTSILDLKKTVAEKMNVPENKLRLLHHKKPCSDLKALKDVVGPKEREVEFSVMVMGGSSGITTGAAPATGDAGAGVQGEVDAESKQQQQKESQRRNMLRGLDSDESDFWKDLETFLLQQFNDGEASQKVLDVFRNAWMAQKE